MLFYVYYQLWMDLFEGVDLIPEQLLDSGWRDPDIEASKQASGVWLCRLAVIVWVAGNLVWDGGHEVIRYFSA